jgi:hypothetical protein
MIYGVYHIGTIGRWKSIVDEQVSKLNSSGLIDKTDKVFIGTSGTDNITVPWDNAEIIIQNPVLTDGETKTLLELHKLCQTLPDSKVWYVHTKGASHTGKYYINVVDEWRRYMMYFLVDKHQDCIEALDYCDACGVEYNYQREFFSGNFWWANSSYIRQLSKLTSNNRWCAEFEFIGTGNPKVKSFYHSNKKIWLESIQRYEYIKVKYL